MKISFNSKASFTIVAFGVAMMAVVHWQEWSALNAARASYRNESRERALDIATSVEASFNTIYSGLRTMARLPGVRAIDRHGENFSGDARTTVQEIYNNLASQVSVSEVYIVPRELEPNRVDPQTGALQTPIVSFDQLIVGRNGAAAEHQASEVAEIEIFEYRLMKQQAAHFADHFGAESKIEGLTYPALTGPEVVTCDNTRYDPARPNDKTRSGLVYSVPFFDNQGVFKGLVSGVILSAVLGELLPDGYYALHNGANQYIAPSSKVGPWQRSGAAIAQELDRVAINGTNTNGQPEGVLANAGIGTFTGTSLNWPGVLSGLRDLEDAGAMYDRRSICFLADTATAETLRGRLRTGTNRFVVEGDDANGWRIGPHRFFSTLHIPSATVLVGDWSQLLVTIWRGIEILPDPYSGATTGKVTLHCWLSADCAAVHPLSFSKATSVT